MEKAGEQQARRAAGREEAAGLHELAFLMASWCRDLLIVSESAGSDGQNDLDREGAHIVNLDRTDDLRQAATGLDPQAVVAALNAVSGAEGLLGYNVESGLWTESLLVRLQNCFGGQF